MTGATARIADAVRTDPGAPIACYDGWGVAELARHVGQVHRWVTGIVAAGAEERPAGFPPAEQDAAALAGWLTDGAATLVTTLAAADPDATVWTISRHDRTNQFWRSRMVFETVLHAWDAEHALGRSTDVDEWLALAGGAEALDIYVQQRLHGKPVGGTGQRVAFVAGDDDGWTLTLREDGVDLTRGADEVDATVTGTALDVWRLVTGRRDLDALTVTGDAAAAAAAVAACAMVPGPAG